MIIVKYPTVAQKAQTHTKKQNTNKKMKTKKKKKKKKTQTKKRQSFHVRPIIGDPSSRYARDVAVKCVTSATTLFKATFLFFWSKFRDKGAKKPNVFNE